MKTRTPLAELQALYERLEKAIEQADSERPTNDQLLELIAAARAVIKELKKASSPPLDLAGVLEA